MTAQTQDRASSRFSWLNSETKLVRRQGAIGPHLEDGQSIFADLLVVGAHAVLYHRKPHDDALRSWAKKLDSTGSKLRGAGEWLSEKHGTSKRRSWRKLHIGIDADSDEIVAFDLTDRVDDASHVGPLLE